MEFVSKLRWVAVIVAILLLLVISVWGIASIARGVFSGSDGLSETAQILEEFAFEDADTVRYSQRGDIVATDEHRSYVIEVSRNVVIMRLYSDYGQTVIDERSYINNEVAYLEFLGALESLNADVRVEGTDEEDDFADAGVCPEARVYVVEIGDDIRRWRSDCFETAPGTAAGNMSAIRRVFAEQIPDFRDIIRGSGLK